MALLEVAVQGATLKDNVVGNTTNASITATPSLNSKVDGKGIHKGSMGILIAAGSGIPGTCVLVNPVSANILPTATKTKNDGNLVIRKNDNVILSGIPGITPASAPCTLNFNISVDNSGQTKVKAE